eukprot:SAG22_NODE_9_length_35992_cov_37.278104_16_plen_419_part_00
MARRAQRHMLAAARQGQRASARMPAAASQLRPRAPHPASPALSSHRSRPHARANFGARGIAIAERSQKQQQQQPHHWRWASRGFHSTPANQMAAAEAPAAPGPDDEEAFRKECAALFARLDTDENGVLSKKEIKKGIKAINESGGMHAKAQSVWKAADTNSSRTVDADEFHAYMKASFARGGFSIVSEPVVEASDPEVPTPAAAAAAAAAAADKAPPQTGGIGDEEQSDKETAPEAEAEAAGVVDGKATDQEEQPEPVPEPEPELEPELEPEELEKAEMHELLMQFDEAKASLDGALEQRAAAYHEATHDLMVNDMVAAWQVHRLIDMSAFRRLATAGMVLMVRNTIESTFGTDELVRGCRQAYPCITKLALAPGVSAQAVAAAEDAAEAAAAAQPAAATEAVDEIDQYVERLADSES